jgi:hypothetical protein
MEPSAPVARLGPGRLSIPRRWWVSVCGGRVAQGRGQVARAAVATHVAEDVES